MKKLSESVWGDLRKKSLGQEKRIENSTNIKDMKPVDLGGSVLWADRDLEKQGKEVFTYDEIQDLISGSEWRLPTKDEAKELDRSGEYESYGYSFTEGDQTLSFRKRKYEHGAVKVYTGWTSTVAVYNSTGKPIHMKVFVLEDNPQHGMIYMGLITNQYSVRLVKDLPNTNESVWNDLRKKSLGQEERAEDKFNPDYIDFGPKTTVYWAVDSLVIDGKEKFEWEEIKDFNRNGWRLPTKEEVEQIDWTHRRISWYNHAWNIEFDDNKILRICTDRDGKNMWTKTHHEKWEHDAYAYGYDNSYKFQIYPSSYYINTHRVFLVKDK